MIKLNDIHLEFDRVLLDNENVDIPYGKITAIIGKSGCGKTTLLQEIALLGKCQCMRYCFDDYVINDLSIYKRNEICRKDISFIFQDVYLFKHLNIKENILFYLSLANKTLTDDEIADLLDFVDLSVDFQSTVHTLSGGELQRLAIVCGLVKDAKLFIFDEPTAYLDHQNKELIMKIIQRLAYEKNKMVLIASHDLDLISICDRVYEIKQQHIHLIKDSGYEDIMSKSETSSLSFKVLQEYIHLILRKQKTIKLCFIVFFSIFLSLMLILQTYSQSYQQKNGTTLIDALNHQLVLSHKDDSPITPEQLALLQHKMSDYTIYSNMKSKGQVKNSEVLLSCYYPHSKGSLHILNSLPQSSSYQHKECDDVYISYSLYRNLILNDP